MISILIKRDIPTINYLKSNRADILVHYYLKLNVAV